MVDHFAAWGGIPLPLLAVFDRPKTVEVVDGRRGHGLEFDLLRRRPHLGLGVDLG